MLQAKGYEPQSSTPVWRSTMTPPTPLPYGWRLVKTRTATGEEIYEQIPLTTYDLLNPQEEDQMPQRNEHFQIINDLVTILKHHYATDPTMGVYGDLIMDWGIPGLPNPAPDIALIPNVKQRDLRGGRFKVVEQGARPCLVMEVMSPWYPGDDTDKVKIYERAGIPEYFLIKPRLKPDAPGYQLSGYRLQDGVYRPLLPTPWGTVLQSQTLQLRFELVNQERQIRVTDLRTGLPLLTLAETEAARVATEMARQQEQAARVVAEAAQREEQAARVAAEAAQREEQAARVAAETAQREEQAARVAAEAAQREERAARLAAEARVRELEELLKSRR